MPDYSSRLKADPLPWLLESDDEQPGVRYFALRWLLRRPETDRGVRAARARVMTSGPVPAILARQHSDGHWESASSIYHPGCRASAWQLNFLAWLGADGCDPKVRAGCDWLLERASGPAGGFSYNGTQAGTIHCLNGELTRALIGLDRLDEDVVQRAITWAADAILGTGKPEYRQSGTSGPLFACAANGKLPCGWGCVKELLALTAVSARRSSKRVREAIDAAAEFLVGHDLAGGAFPTATSVSRCWVRFGFPSSYSADVLEALFALAEAGRAADCRARPAIELLLEKQDAAGRWVLETSLNGKMFVDVERRGRPSKWLTLRAMRVLQAASS
jgi:hypothetical protein